jgi:hypothetical protein
MSSFWYLSLIQERCDSSLGVSGQYNRLLGRKLLANSNFVPSLARLISTPSRHRCACRSEAVYSNRMSQMIFMGSRPWIGLGAPQNRVYYGTERNGQAERESAQVEPPMSGEFMCMAQFYPQGTPLHRSPTFTRLDI